MKSTLRATKSRESFHVGLSSPIIHSTPQSSYHLDDWIYSSKVHRREPYHVRSIELLFRLPFIVRQPFDSMMLELLLTSPFYTPETSTLQYHKLSVLDTATHLKWLKWTLHLCRAFLKKSQLFTRGESLELRLKYLDFPYLCLWLTSELTASSLLSVPSMAWL